MYPQLRRYFPFAAAAALIACADPGKAQNKLVIQSAAPLTLAVGDTSASIHVSKTSVDAQGRESTDPDYGNFTLVSGDTGVVKVVSGRRVAAVASGHTAVTAHDDRSTLISENQLSVTVP